MTQYEMLNNTIFFILNQTGSIFGKVETRMTAKEQRKLFGTFLGKGTLTLDGLNETITHTVMVPFGGDSMTKGFINLTTGNITND